MIIRARVVVPMENAPIENGAVAIEGSQIAGVGSFDEIRARHAGEVHDLGEQILLPGLINAHCHLDYTILRGKVPAGQSFADWIVAINAGKAALSQNDYLSSIAAGFSEAQSWGTTTILNLEAFPELLPRLSRPPLRTWWCAEMIDLRKEVPVREVAASLHGWFESNPAWLGGFGLAPHAPFTASSRLYSEASEIAQEYHVPFTTHLAESHEEMQMFRDRNGALFDFLKDLGRPMDNGGRETPLAFLLRNQRITKRWIVAHLNQLAASDFDLLAAAEKFSIAHCPRSHTFFGHAPFRLEKLRALGFNICLGTDSLASNSTLSLFAEMRELLRKTPSLSPAEVLEMATVNGAMAIGQQNSLGRIAPGFLADLIAIPCGPPGSEVFDTIVAFAETVPWTMVNGARLSRP
jgi:cytosine/adenosine deaminase-related metal-dependent hydrolase